MTLNAMKHKPASILPRPLEASDAEMALFQGFFQQAIGLYLSANKKSLLTGRLAARINELELPDLRAYHQLITTPGEEAEQQRAIDLITTNETYFFRESGHFTFLAQKILPALARHADVRIWSAASSTGEEAYSIAMLLDQHRKTMPWHIEASDISSRVLSYAKRGLYPLQRGEKIPDHYLKQHCLRGSDAYEGHFLVQQQLRDRVHFSQKNLLELPHNLGLFDVIFLRNVLIYFDPPTKVQVIQNICHHLKPGAWLFIGHAESLNGLDVNLKLKSCGPSIYQIGT
ncbi:CheR family methyltransferase [Deefgea rivuli]|uniref:CheR family methyltransferase n=1 Tax=Deefgea rivuli TaxID=400948 RepID=UPI001FDF65FD|nr:protein-glutamate O-methyltransferase CheR [Deefgea rivuli]